MTSAAQRLRCLPSPNEIKTDLREDLALMVHTREQMFPGVGRGCGHSGVQPGGARGCRRGGVCGVGVVE